MALTVYTLDCRQMTTPEAAHAYLKETLSFPEYYGNNLDALYDCLCDMPACVIELKYAFALAALEDYAVPLLQTFCDAAAEYGRITLL